MEAEETNTVVSFRKNVFQKIYPTENISLLSRRGFFELESSQISYNDKYSYRDYFSELWNIENQIKEDERKIKEDERKNLLLSLYSTKDMESLVQNLPANIFYGQVQEIERKMYILYFPRW